MTHDDEAQRLAARFHAENPTMMEGPKMTNLSTVTPRPLEWLWRGRIPMGKLTVIAGDPGLGKSFVTLDVAARVSKGRRFPDALDEPVQAGGVVILTAEDDLEDTIQPRLVTLGADLRRIEALEASIILDPESGEMRERMFDLLDIPTLDAAIDRTPDCRLVVVDPIAAFLGNRTDAHRDADVRNVLRPLSDLARRRRVAIVAVMHLNKGAGKAMYRTMGSLAFTAAARAVLAVSKDPDDDARRLVIPVKCNLAPDAAGLSYRLKADRPGDMPFVEWDPTPVDMTADEALASAVNERSSPGALEEAKDWLEGMLHDQDRTARELQEQAEEDGIAWRTIERAKQAIGAKSDRRKVDGRDCWVWTLQTP